VAVTIPHAAGTNTELLFYGPLAQHGAGKCVYNEPTQKKDLCILSLSGPFVQHGKTLSLVNLRANLRALNSYLRTGVHAISQELNLQFRSKFLNGRDSETLIHRRRTSQDGNKLVAQSPGTSCDPPLALEGDAVLRSALLSRIRLVRLALPPTSKRADGRNCAHVFCFARGAATHRRDHSSGQNRLYLSQSSRTCCFPVSIEARVWDVSMELQRSPLQGSGAYQFRSLLDSPFRLARVFS
jgi:hypothetical protein